MLAMRAALAASPGNLPSDSSELSIAGAHLKKMKAKTLQHVHVMTQCCCCQHDPRGYHHLSIIQNQGNLMNSQQRTCLARPSMSQLAVAMQGCCWQQR